MRGRCLEPHSTRYSTSGSSVAVAGAVRLVWRIAFGRRSNHCAIWTGLAYNLDGRADTVQPWLIQVVSGHTRRAYRTGSRRSYLELQAGSRLMQGRRSMYAVAHRVDEINHGARAGRPRTLQQSRRSGRQTLSRRDASVRSCSAHSSAEPNYTLGGHYVRNSDGTRTTGGTGEAAPV